MEDGRWRAPKVVGEFGGRTVGEKMKNGRGEAGEGQMAGRRESFCKKVMEDP